MRWTLQQCVTATIAYSAIFDYPLTPTEIRRFLIKPPQQSTPRFSSHALEKYQYSEGYYALNKATALVKKRRENERFSQPKWEIVAKAVALLASLPTLEAVFVSGSLAVNNAEEGDDIDLFILTKPNTIWVSRLLVLICLTLLGKRRSFNTTIEKDLLCPNMLMTSSRMAIPVGQRDLYIAHEIVQMVPILSRNQMHLKFLQANHWVEAFLPYSYQDAMIRAQSFSTKKSGILTVLAANLCVSIEFLAKHFQLVFIQRHRTTEVITDQVLRFHPKDVKGTIQQKFESILRDHQIPLDSQFFRVLR